MGEYLKDGILYCDKCNTPKQIVLAGSNAKMPILCECEHQEMIEREAQEKEREARQKRQSARVACFPYDVMHDYTIGKDDRENQEVTELCEKYINNFGQFKEANAGLIFYGAVGTGKTYHAASIANGIIDQGYKALFTSLSTLGAKMSEDYGKNRLSVLSDICKYDLVILDDLGIERTTSTMNENVYQIINALYQSETIMIFTTNMDVSTMQKVTDPNETRIYSRILECCKPVKVTGSDRRRGKAREKAQLFKELLG